MKMARGCRVVISEIKDAYFYKSEGDFEPNYIITKDAQKIPRVKLVGLVKRVTTSKEDPAVKNGIILYDDTGEIFVTGNNDTIDVFEHINPGDFVQVVGRPTLSKYGDIIVVAEGISKVSTKMDIIHKLKVIKKIREHSSKVKIAYDIYNQYGLSTRAVRIAQERGISRDMLDAIDKLIYLHEEELKREEFLMED